jgi:hypothetical protein
MPVSTHHQESCHTGGYVNDGGLLDPTCPATKDRHLLTHYYVALQHVVSGEYQSVSVDLELIKLAYLMAVAWPHAAKLTS